MKISCKKFKNHLQFYMKIFLKKKSSFFPGKSLYFFFQNHTFENIFEKIIVAVWFWKFLKISPTCSKFNTHKKIVVHFFIPMLLLPLTPPLIYLKLKKFKGPKMDSLHFFTFHFSLSLFSLAIKNKGSPKNYFHFFTFHFSLSLFTSSYTIDLGESYRGRYRRPAE